MKQPLLYSLIGRSRIITISMHEGDASDVKVNLTLRQPGLGSLQWLDTEREAAKAKGEQH